MSSRAVGTSREADVRKIQASWGLLPWKPKNAAFRTPGGKWISHSQDVLGCLDLLAVRSDLGVVGSQVGDRANQGHKRRQVGEIFGPIYVKGSKLADGLDLLLWLWDPGARVYRVQKALPGLPGAPKLEWAQLGLVRVRRGRTRPVQVRGELAEASAELLRYGWRRGAPP